VAFGEETDADAALLTKVEDFLRVESGDPTVPPIIDAAIGWLANAGAARPDGTDPLKLAQYELAVTIYVNTIFSGGESKLEAAMTSIVYQLRN